MLTAGIDEAGRGPLAGPVVVAAVVLNPRLPIAGLQDSKILSKRQRERLFPEIQKHALCWSIVEVAVQEIDEINILQATLSGMRKAEQSLDQRPELALVDGNRDPGLPCKTRTIVQGDRLEPAISAASILAKVHRDRLMVAMHQSYPHYGFDQHKGYPTAMHLQRLKEFGPCAEHRRSFAPVRNALQSSLI